MDWDESDEYDTDNAIEVRVATPDAPRPNHKVTRKRLGYTSPEAQLESPIQGPPKLRWYSAIIRANRAQTYK